MANVTIASITGPPFDQRDIVLHALVEVTKDVFYVFYVATATTIVYKKSSDGGLTWGSAINIYSGVKVFTLDVWADWWPHGGIGSGIHIAWMARTGGTNTREYRSLDTNGDTLGTAVSWHGSGSISTLDNGWHETSLTIWQSRAGRLHIFANMDDGASDQIHAISSDDGATWDSTKTPLFTSDVRKCIGLPGNELEFDDMWLISMDKSAVVRIGVYDFSADSWSESTIVSLTTSDFFDFQLSAVTRYRDRHVILAVWSQVNNAGSDYRVFDITSRTVIAELTAIHTNRDDTYASDMVIDQSNGDLYVIHMDGAFQVNAIAYYHLSTDDGVTWGAATALSETGDNIDWVRVCQYPPVGGGSVLAVWYNVDTDVLQTNPSLSVATDPFGESLGALKGQFQILADWSGNNDFVGSDEDITADVRSLHVEHVRDYRTDYIEPRQLSLVLNNEDHKYSPPKGTITGLAAGVKIWVRTWYPFDSFADVDATDLDAHTPDFDSNWPWVHPVDARAFQIDNASSAAKTDGSDAGNYYAYMEFNDKDVNISANIKSTITGGNPGLLFRFVDSSNLLFVRCIVGSSNNIEVRSRIAASETSEALGSFTWNADETHFVHVRLHGTRIWVFIDNSEVIDFTFSNAAVDNGTKHGIVATAASSDARWEDFGGFKSLFFGLITSIVPVPDAQDQRCLIEALDEFDQFDRGKLHFANTTASSAQRSDQMLAELLTAGGFTRDSQLGTGKTLMSDVDRGLKSITTTLLATVQKLQDEEDGFVYIDGIGDVIMEERAHRDSAPHTVTKAYVAEKNTSTRIGFSHLEWDDGNEGVENVMTARTKESTKASAAAVWVHPEAHTSPDSTLQFDANETKDFIAETDSDAADGWDALVENTDYEANAAAGGGGSDISSELTVLQPDTDEYTGKHRKIRVVFGATAGFLTLFQIQADARTQDNEPSQVHVEDSTSRASFGIRPFEIDCIFTHRADVARDTIVSRLARRKNSKTQLIITLPISTKLGLHHAIQRRISDRVTAIYADMGINEAFFMEGEVWDVEEGGTSITVTWYLRGV